MKEIANKNGVPNQEHHGFKVLADWQSEHLSTRQFEACTRRDMYACVLCRARPIEGGAEITSKVPVPIGITNMRRLRSWRFLLKIKIPATQLS